MSLDIGIIGLPRSGRTTVFNALTRGTADVDTYTTKAKAPHIGIAKVPDARLCRLTAMFKPKKEVPAEVRYIDIGASIKDLAANQGISGELLNQISGVDALLHVVRAFESESVPYPEGSVDVSRDIVTMDMELAFSDLAIIERRLEKIEKSLKAARPSERQPFLHEQDLLSRLKVSLEKDIPIRELELSAEEMKLISPYQFLTAKPLLAVVNIGEAELGKQAPLELELSASHARADCALAALCGELEMELGQLDNEAAGELCVEYGITERGLNRVLRLSYGLLGLISFFTVGEDETRAWSIRKGTPAVKAAGKIHSDIERGFIRAEVVGYQDLIDCGSQPEARRKGLLRLEGKTYIVQDGDIINFLFNV